MICEVRVDYNSPRGVPAQVNGPTISIDERATYQGVVDGFLNECLKFGAIETIPQGVSDVQVTLNDGTVFYPVMTATVVAGTKLMHFKMLNAVTFTHLKIAKVQSA